MSSILHGRRVPQVWRITILGVAASVPAAAVINRLPNSETTLGAAVMLVGAAIAGAVAATRSVDPGAVGLRAGFLGGVVAVLTSLPAVGAMAAWPVSRLVFFAFAGVVIVCIAPGFGWVCGRIGGWVANAVTGRWSGQE